MIKHEWGMKNNETQAKIKESCERAMRQIEKENKTMDNNLLWDKLNKHFGHNVVIVRYGDVDDPASVCLECEDCCEVILDAELYTLYEKDEEE